MKQFSKCRIGAFATFCAMSVIGVVGLQSPVSAGKNKVEICHQTKKGGAKLILVSEKNVELIGWIKAVLTEIDSY